MSGQRKDKVTNDKVTAFLRSYYKPINDEMAELREYGEENNVPIILKETELYTNTLLELYRPKKILEIGTAIGYSSIYFATVCEDAEIYTIEKDPKIVKMAEENIAKFGLQSRITCLEGDGEEQIEELYRRGICDFDFVFIDAAKSHYTRFLQSALSVCKVGAVILSDNIMQHGMTVYYDIEKYRKHRTNVRKMREYVDFVCNDKRLNTSLMAIGDGVALSIYKEKYEEI